MARLERTGPAIRAVLAELDPAACSEFEWEFRIALAETDLADDFDLGRLNAVLDRWLGIAYLRLHPPTAAERAVVEQVRRGDFTGLRTRTAAGEWVKH
ncbi:DUF6247 family protein [Mycolicibacterium aubagnense]|uniref:Uncharacterized protein n=1 Tax=Mycolicibacterium aubagnense TaxID=319707 RepID=A0ABM7I6K5_9MYCO|nr:DUF6247 family protein [Mycolicibacterium aubagnense]TLH64447.1 hypothetical protein C1S80_12240 [Mycolicibacterium aubagnense]BBX82181.1 hypothetical protein MAUB_00540 [Mycolicibacterium aubagnense]